MGQTLRPALLVLTCSSSEEADRIADALLEQRLIACAKQLPVSSQFHWQGKRERAHEVLLLLESREDQFAAIETAVRSLHSHATFVLMALPVAAVSAGVQQWIDESLRRSVARAF